MGFLDRFRKSREGRQDCLAATPEQAPQVTPDIRASWDALSPEDQAAWHWLSDEVAVRAADLTPEQHLALEKVAADVAMARALGLNSADEASIAEEFRRCEELKPRWAALLSDLERLKQMKRDGELDSARVLALDLVDRAEQLANDEVTVCDGVVFVPPPAPAYTKEAAIVLRKLKDYDAEVEILERYERAARGSDGNYTVQEEMINDRLPKARALRDKTKDPR